MIYRETFGGARGIIARRAARRRRRFKVSNGEGGTGVGDIFIDIAMDASSDAKSCFAADGDWNHYKPSIFPGLDLINGVKDFFKTIKCVDILILCC